MADLAQAFDFSDLTPTQQRLLTFQGWQPGQLQQGKQPVERHVRKLVDRGLVVVRDATFLGVSMKAYDVPIHVHAAWCAHCEQQEGKAA